MKLLMNRRISLIDVSRVALSVIAAVFALSSGFTLTAQEIPTFVRTKQVKEAPAVPQGKPAFYGIELEGQSLAFLLDISGSMGGNKLERLKSEMRRITAGLRMPDKDSKVSEHGIYRIYAFNSGEPVQFPARGAARVGGSEAFDSATKFVDGLQAGGSTEMLKAWNTMLNDYGAQPPNTVYFLSDGDPTDCTPDILLGMLRKRNLPSANGTKAIKIHCVSIGQTSQLLKDIAEENGGYYIEVK